MYGTVNTSSEIVGSFTGSGFWEIHSHPALANEPREGIHLANQASTHLRTSVIVIGFDSFGCTSTSNLVSFRENVFAFSILSKSNSRIKRSKRVWNAFLCAKLILKWFVCIKEWRLQIVSFLPRIVFTKESNNNFIESLVWFFPMKSSISACNSLKIWNSF